MLLAAFDDWLFQLALKKDTAMAAVSADSSNQQQIINIQLNLIYRAYAGSYENGCETTSKRKKSQYVATSAIFGTRAVVGFFFNKAPFESCSDWLISEAAASIAGQVNNKHTIYVQARRIIAPASSLVYHFFYFDPCMPRC